ncbi:MAG: virginiamycin B lyase [Gammaproteobacteria bacterium]|jgi:virginiamycin B lyase
MRMNIRIRNYIVITGVILTLSLINSTSLVLAAGDAFISGVVTDSGGKPVRGVTVKANLGSKTVSKYTNNAGHYRIEGLDPALHNVTVDGKGYALVNKEVDPSQNSELNFTLTSHMDVSRLVSAEMRFLIPETSDAIQVYDRCSNCHGLETALRSAGMPAAGWEAFLPGMTLRRSGTSQFDDALVAKMLPGVDILLGHEGLLGPMKTELDYSKVKFSALTDKALKATIIEWKIPTDEAMAHSVTVDENSGMVWFSEIDVLSNKIGRFDPITETFAEFPIPVPESHAHTGTVMKDGRFIVAMATEGGVDEKLIAATADGELEIYSWPEKPQGARVVVKDPTREDILWIVARNDTWSLNTKTKEFRAYPNPRPASVPEGSYAQKYGRGVNAINSYALAVDSKGFPWVTQFNLGVIFRIDPDTGETKSFHTPEMLSSRGIGVDADDNIWYADYYGNKLGMLDPNTGKVTLYQPPTEYATPYGITVDKKRGHIWYADTAGNNITRFDPKTGEFIEFSVPTRNTSVRFMGVDPEGRAWYGGHWGGQIGMIDPGDGG